MDDFIFRKSNFKDIPFLVETIIEAEKSGTSVLSYSTVFHITEEESRYYISQMLEEEIDGCELSISSFLIAEQSGRPAGATAVWIEGSDGIPSTILKGNLLSYILPKDKLVCALQSKHIISELYIEPQSDTLQLGLVYVASEFRGHNLSNRLINEQIIRYKKVKPSIKEMFVQVFPENVTAVKAYEKAGFETILIKESFLNNILLYLPSNRKMLMRKRI